MDGYERRNLWIDYDYKYWAYRGITGNRVQTDLRRSTDTLTVTTVVFVVLEIVFCEIGLSCLAMDSSSLFVFCRTTVVVKAKAIVSFRFVRWIHFVRRWHHVKATATVQR
jgi:hypothetical protein